MSGVIEIPEEVAELPDLQAQVYFELARSAVNGRSRIPIRTLAERLRCGKSTVHQALQSLESAGHIAGQIGTEPRTIPPTYLLPALAVTTKPRTIPDRVPDSSGQKTETIETVRPVELSTHEVKNEHALVPTKDRPISVESIDQTLRELKHREDHQKNLRVLQVYAVFSYWCARTGATRALLSRDRFTRLERFVKERGVDWCFYVIDGGMKHPDLNHDDGRKFHGLDSFFSLKSADRPEKLVAITAYERRPRHPLVAKHPELVDEAES